MQDLRVGRNVGKAHQTRKNTQRSIFCMEKFVFLQSNLKETTMVIERTLDEFIIRFPVTAQVEQMQDMVDYLRYKELTAASIAKQAEVDSLSREINKNWWKKNQVNVL
jgi:hypothetical protein